MASVYQYAGIRLPGLSHLNPLPVDAPAVSELDSDTEDGEVEDETPAVIVPDAVLATNAAKATHNVAHDLSSHLPRLASITAVPSTRSLQSMTEPFSLTTSEQQFSDDWLLTQKVKAKAFLLRWYSSGHKFSDLVQEGLNNDILTQLYKETGLHSAIQPLHTGQTAKTASPTAVAAQTLMNSVQQPPRAQTYTKSRLPAKQAELPSTTTASPHAPNTGVQASQPAARSAGKREDYIARLLAAKNKKQGSQVSEGSEKSPAPAIGPLARSDNDFQSRGGSNRVQADVARNKEPSQRQHTVAVADLAAEAKRRAQTALARARMEVLAKQKATAAARRTEGAATASQDNQALQAVLPGNQTQDTRNAAAPTSHVPNFLGSMPGLYGGLNGQPKQTHVYSDSTPTASNGDGGVALKTQDDSNRQASLRKRPLAEDFMDSTWVPNKRPFGIPRNGDGNEPVIIQVSDDESSSEESASAQQGTLSFRDSPSLSEGSLRRQAKAKDQSSRQQEHDQSESAKKQLEILAMKNRIAELEEKRRKGKSTAPAAPLPIVPASNGMAKDSAASDSAQPKPVARPTISDSYDWKSQRRNEIQRNMPDLDARMLSNNARMEALRAQMQQLQDDMRLEQEDKARLAAELESLGIDTMGMDHDELRETRKEINDMVDAAAQAANEKASPLAAPDVRVEDSGEQMSESSGEEADVSIQTSVGDSSENAIQNEAFEAMDESEDDEIADSDTARADGGVAISQESREDSTYVTDEPPRNAEHGEVEDSSEVQEIESEGEQAHEAAYSTDESREEIAMDFSDDDAPPDDAADSLNDEPAASANVDQTEAARKGPIDVERDSLPIDESQDPGTEEGEISSEDPPNIQDQPTVIEPLVQAGHFDHEQSSGTAIEETLQPPVEDQDTTTVIADAEGSDDEDYEPPDAAGEVKSSHRGPEQTTVDVRATNGDEALQKILSVDRSSDAEPDTIDAEYNYRPYESALRTFKSYRNRPSAIESWRSLSFSHRIDPNNPWCETEAAGGQCTDLDCTDQHSKQWTLADEELLLEMGSSNPGTTDDERKKYNDGLRELLVRLKDDSAADADRIAHAIRDYRALFVQDPSQVLDL